MRRLSLALVAFIVVGCSSKTSKDSVQGKTLEVIASTNRHLELEPCGCSINPIGGVDREWNWLQSIAPSKSTQRLYMASGTTFLPEKENYKPALKSHYLAKAGFVVEALNQLGVQVLAPSASDFVYGVEPLRKLASEAHFPLVTTNIMASSGDTVFQESWRPELGGLDALVVSAASPAKKPFANREVTIEDPKKALSKVLAKTSRKTFVILLSSLPEKQLEPLLREFPQIRVVVGAQDKDLASDTIKLLAGRALLLNPADLGKEVAHLKIELTPELGAYYNEKVAPFYKDFREDWKRQLVDLENRLQARRSAKLEKEKEEIQRKLKESESIPLEHLPGTMAYEAQYVPLGRQYIEPKNELLSLVDRYKQAVRAIAISESK